MQANPNSHVAWQPFPGSQVMALSSPCNETLYCGSRGPGKTEIQIMRYRRNVGIGYGRYWRGVIFDREHKNLDDVVAKSERIADKFDDGAKLLKSTSDYKWVWPTGEELLLRTMKKLSDYSNYHGHEFPFIGWNELTKQPTSEFYDLMISCNRSSWTKEDGPRDRQGKLKDIPKMPLDIFSTTNSLGVGQLWVKRRFIDVAPYGQIVKVTRNIFNPQTKTMEDVIRSQVAIFGSYRENPKLPPEYIAGLDSIKDENTRRSWLHGDWNVVCGGAFEDAWSKWNVIKRFKIPSNWYIDRTFDWGSSTPFSIGWWAEANGEECEIEMEDGSIYKWCPVRGSIIQFYEWYGAKEIGTNKGLKLSPAVIAEGIKNTENMLLREGWISRLPSPGPADNQIDNVTRIDIETIKKSMADKNVIWTDSDKTKGSRRIGFLLFRAMLENAVPTGDNTEPAIYFMENCRASITTIPSLQRDEVEIDDVDKLGETHTWDMTRYRVLKGSNRIVTKLNILYPN